MDFRALKNQNMKVAKLIKNYSRLSEAKLDYKAQSIVHELTGNPSFPETDPSLADFTAVKDAYIIARENAANRGKTEIAIKNQNKQLLLEKMSLLATNLESLAKGDRAKLTSTGFDLVKNAEPKPPITGPLVLRLTDGLNPGELKLSVNAISGAVSYNYEFTPDPLTTDSQWIIKSSTAKQHVFNGLPSGTKIYARVAAIARKNQELYSETLSRVVQ